MIATHESICPCHRERRYADCCQRYHEGLVAENAEALMRSRYSAYVLSLQDYLLRTWHASTRPAQLDSTPSPEWLGLSVKRHVEIDADHATVEFVARYRVAGRQHRLHEISRFVRDAGVWYYVDGVFPTRG